MGFPFPYILYRKQQPPGKADLAEQFPELSVGPVKTCSFNAALCDALLRGGVPRPRPRRVPLVRRLAPLVRRTQSPSASNLPPGPPPGPPKQNIDLLYGGYRSRCDITKRNFFFPCQWTKTVMAKTYRSSLLIHPPRERRPKGWPLGRWLGDASS
eukprot:gene13975-biopygen12605